MAFSSEFKPVADCQNSVMHFYQQQIKQQRQLLNQVKGAIPENLAEHVVHCVVYKKELYLYTDSAVWSAQLRFYQPTILQYFSQLSYPINALKVRLIPATTQSKTVTKPLLPSQKNIDSMRDIAHTVSDDKLQQALLRLSNRLEQSSSDTVAKD